MQPEVENPPSQEEATPGLKRSVDLVVSPEDIDRCVQEELKRLAKKSKMPGFRPGKVPIAMLERSHGLSIRQDVVNTQITKALEDALNRDQLRMAGPPNITPKMLNGPDNTLVFTATFEVYPEVSLPDFKPLIVTRYQTTVNDADVDETLEMLRRQRATYEVREDRLPEEGDQVKVDFMSPPLNGVGGDTLPALTSELATDAHEAEPLKFAAQDFVFVLGKGRMLPEFETAVKGLRVGETTAIPLTFPDDYSNKDFAGKTLDVTITLKEVAEPLLPELDAEFAKTLGQEAGDLEKLKSEIHENLEREVARRLHERTKSSVLETLATAVTFEVPQVLVEREINRANAATREKLQRLGLLQDTELPVSMMLSEEEAKRRVRLGLLCAELVEQKQLQPKSEQVWEKLAAFAQDYEAPAQLIEHYLSDRQRRSEFEALVTEDNIVTYLLEEAQVVEEVVPFAELMGITQ